jgi:hypothetical protein
MNGRTETTMRVIYVRLLISGALLAAMLTLGAFGQQSDGITAATTAHHVDAAQRRRGV